MRLKFQSNLDAWIFPRRYRIMILLFLVLILFAANFLPYVNLFSSTYLICFIALILAPFILDVDGKIFIILGVLGLVFVFFIWSLGQAEEAEIVTNYIFILLLSGTTRILLH